MAWHEIPYSSGWEYNDSPEEPPITNTGRHALWEKQVNGIRTVGNVLIYVDCRRQGSIIPHAGELNKTYWDYIAVREGGVPSPPVNENAMEFMDGELAQFQDGIQIEF